MRRGELDRVGVGAVLAAGQEADRDPGGDPERPRHDRHRRGELHAETPLLVQERGDRVTPGVRGRPRRVGEAAVLTEPLLQHQGLVVLADDVLGQVGGGRADDVGQRAGQSRVGGADGVRWFGGGAQLLGRRCDVEVVDAVALVAHRLALAEHVQRAGVVEPGALDVDPAGRVGQREEVLVERAADLDAHRVGLACDVGGQPRGSRHPAAGPLAPRHLGGGGSPLVAVEAVGGEQPQRGDRLRSGGVAQHLDVAARVEVVAQRQHRVDHRDAGAPVTRAAAGRQQPLGQARREGGHEHRDGDRRDAQPPAGGGQGAGVAGHAHPGAGRRPAPPGQQPAPAQHPGARVVRQQQQPAEGGRHEVPRRQPVRDDGGRDAVQREQRKPGGGRCPQGDRDQVDHDGDAEHPGRDQQRDPVADGHRRLIAVDGVAAVRDDPRERGDGVRPGQQAEHRLTAGEHRGEPDQPDEQLRRRDRRDGQADGARAVPDPHDDQQHQQAGVPPAAAVDDR